MHIKALSYIGDFDDALGETVTVVFLLNGYEFKEFGKLVKPGFTDTDIIYFLQNIDNPNARLTPIDNEATVYRGASQTDIIGVVEVGGVSCSALKKPKT